MNMEGYVTGCVTLIQASYRKWRDIRLMRAVKEDFLDICKEIEHSIKSENSVQYKSEVSFDSIGSTRFHETVDEVPLFQDTLLHYAALASARRQQNTLLVESLESKAGEEISENEATSENHMILDTQKQRRDLQNCEEPTMSSSSNIEKMKSSGVFSLTAIDRDSFALEDIGFFEPDGVHTVSDNDETYKQIPPLAQTAESSQNVAAGDNVDVLREGVDGEIKSGPMTSYSTMTLEDLRKEEKWLEKAILARIKHLTKSDENGFY